MLILNGSVSMHFSEITKYCFGVQKKRKINISDAKNLKQKRRNEAKVIYKVWIVLDCS